MSPTSALRERPRVAFIGTLDVAPTFGGPIQFHRHFVERDDFEFEKFIEQPTRRLGHLHAGVGPLDRLVTRASQTRLFPHFVAVNELLGIRRAVPSLVARVSAFRPDAIVTVAFGAYGFAAAHVARRLGIPLLTFFHDWWPDLALESAWGVRAFDRRIRWLYARSDVALCVCEEMRRELGPHPRAEVLYPIPGRAPKSAPRTANARPRVVYLGGMTRGYGRMLAALARAYVNAPGPRSWELAVYGDTSDWPAADGEFGTSAGILRGPRYGDAVHQALDAADIFLVVMDFEAATRRRVRTSFPSKLLDYCGYGRPIVGWAPPYASLARFAEAKRFPRAQTEADAAAFVATIDRLAGDSAARAQLADQAMEFSRGIFSPDEIHAQLVDTINSTIAAHSAHAR